MVNASDSDITYALSKQFSITFSPYEDRLVVRSDLGEHGAATLLLTRRMVMIVLQQLLSKLPELTGLNKTPAQYWQEVLQMAHQQAMQAKSQADQAQTEASGEPSSATAGDDAAKGKSSGKPAIYLATELTVQIQEGQLVLGFKGLPMPQAMTMASAHVPVFATPLQSEHVHQLIELLITKSQEAQWHLPLDLPWLENPKAQQTSLGLSSLH
jgi:hypothetical protein